MFNKEAFREWRERHFGKGKVVSGKSIAPKFEPTERCTDCAYFYEDLWCLKKKRSGRGCNVPLLFTSICPSCQRVRQGKREWGETIIYFKCMGETRSGHPCGCLYSLSFHGSSDSAVEISKRQWLAGEGDEWSDYTLRRKQ